MHLPHLMRAYSKLVETWDEREGYNDGWNDALESLKEIRGDIPPYYYIDISSCLNSYPSCLIKTIAALSKVF